MYVVTVFSRNGFLLDTHQLETWNEVSDLLDNLQEARLRDKPGGHFEIMFHQTNCLLEPGHSGACIPGEED